MLHHRLIIFYGASSGAGKSTLSSFLVDQLRLHKVSVRWLYEDDVVYQDAFAEVIRGFQGQEPFDAFGSLLAASARFVAGCLQEDAVVVTDSIFPFFDWLYAAAPAYEQMAQFSYDLQRILHPLQPLLVYLNGDVEPALRRAVAQRGQRWLDELIPWMNTWAQNQSLPIHDIEGVIAYAQQRHRVNLQLFTEWAGDLLLIDTVSNPLAHCQNILLEQVGLTLRHNLYRLPVAVLERYVGVYRRQDEGGAVEQSLTIRCIGDALFVDAYWPKGCPLVAVNETTFQLQNTSHRIEFHAPVPDGSQEFTYHYCGHDYRYMKIDT